MTFLNPLVLFGLIAAGIPLLIHLFNFRRPRRVDFSSLVFLKELQQTTMQRVRIKQWLLLLLRTAAIASLVLAFARPTLEGSLAGAAGDAESAVVVVIDNSMSMTTRDRDGLLLEQAAEMASELVGLMRPGDQMAILHSADPGGRGEPVWHKTRGAALEAVSSLQPSYGTGRLWESIEKARELLSETSYVNREIYVFSDFQSSTLGDGPASTVVDRLPVRLVRLGGTTPRANTSVDNVEVVSQIVEQGQPVRVRALVSSHTDVKAPAGVASVFLDGERVAQATVQPDPESTTSVEFAITPRQPGWLGGEVRIEDDDFPVDNSRYFTLYVPEERSILLVRGPSFRSEYIELALSSRLAPGRTRFALTTIPSSELSSVQLGQYDVVLIAGVDRFSSGEIAFVGEYVKEGGGLLLFPPLADAGGNFDAMLEALAGGRLRGFVGGTSEAVAEIESVDLDHPLFEGVFDAAEQASQRRIERTEVFRYADYEPVTPSELTLMRLSSGRPFLQEMRPGAGRALFMTSLPDPAWSELPVRGLFVPLLFRALHYLSSGDAVTGGDVILGQNTEIRIPSAAPGEPVLVHASDIDFVPEQRSAFGGILATLGPELVEPGVADVRLGGAVVRRVSVNADATEFDLRAVESEEAARRLGGAEAGVQVLVADVETHSLAPEVRTLRTGIELWNVFLTLALVFLVAEMLVARHWNPESTSG